MAVLAMATILCTRCPLVAELGLISVRRIIHWHTLLNSNNMIQPIEQLKKWFVKYAYPTQQQFWDWLDSYWHKNETIPVNKISGLDEVINNVTSGINDVLNNKQDKTDNWLQTNDKTVVGAINELKEAIQPPEPEIPEPFIKITISATDNSRMRTGNIQGAIVDWGDGTPLETITAVASIHTFAVAGNYVVTIMNLTEIPKNVVSQSGVEVISVEVGRGVTKIGDNAFSSLKLSTCIISDTVTEIGSKAFSSCVNLTNCVIPDSVLTIGNGAFTSCQALTSIILPRHLTYIEDSLFLNCLLLESIDIPATVKSIGGDAFKNCQALTNVVMPDSVTQIGYGAFSGCTNFSGAIGRSVLNIASYAFSGCTKLTGITIPASVLAIGMEAFSGCENMTYIGVDSSNPVFSSYGGILCDKFSQTILRYPYKKTGAYLIQPGFTNIENSAFLDSTELTSITFTNSITRIGGSAFASCGKLTTVVLNEGLLHIGLFAFNGSALKSVIIPASVLSIGNGAFYCPELESVKMMSATPPITVNGNPIKGVDNLIIYIPAGSLAAYQAAPVWSNYAGNFVEY
jgi:hypothetical protein